MIKPLALKRGDRIAVVSLSSGMAGEEAFLPRFQTGIDRLKQEFDLEVTVMPHALKGVSYLYHHPELLALDMMEAFLDPEIKGIICAIGGDDAVRLLPYIGYDVIRNNPKVFMGYSDTTINHLMMYKAGVVSFYGPSVMMELAENVAMHEYTKFHIENVLFSGKNPLPIEPSPQWTAEFLYWAVPENNRTLRKMVPDAKGYELLQGSGKVRGRLIGGCCGVPQMAVGTEIWPSTQDFRDAILFLETGEDYPTPSNLTCFLRNLAAQGIFDLLQGIVVCKPLGETYYEEYKEAYLSVVGIEAKRPHLPILYNFNCSHNAPMSILPYGIQAELDCEAKGLTLLEPAVLPV